jgi:alkanesulfonate monooxygenase SsuD/methylene tetrahydromethanopterin reductase-like flavin-dependent oxidoreductase (luciferase family)
MKVLVEISHLAASMNRRQFADAIRELDDSGAAGVSVADHIFATHGGKHRRDSSSPTCDPLTTLAVVAGLSDRLELQTIVVNTAWVHPALVLRQFAQLAQFVGGGRVTAGLGAGWSAEEFDALGLKMPAFSRRIARLEEVLSLARALFDAGITSVEGEYVTARDVPLSPRPVVAPALLVGGGSDRILQMAGRYADVVDLHGHPARGKVVGATMDDARRGDVRRRALTTVEDLVDRIQLVRQAAEDSGRQRNSVSVSGSIFFTAHGSRSDVEQAQAELCDHWAQIPRQSLDRSPYFLFGEPQQMADTLRERQERYRLERITLLTEPGIAAAPPDPLRFCREVLPLL